MEIIRLQKHHFPAVAEIYKEGLATGLASFETTVPSWDAWNEKFLDRCRFVLTNNDVVLGWCALSPVSKRVVYSGVAENTIYISPKHQGKGLGRRLLLHLIENSEANGFWTLQASVFPQNLTSLNLHLHCGFRRVGTRERIAKRDGVWHDNILLEKRTKN
ncbi:GNAT family N-acetyltransferase [Altibacter lentus]|uniref:GNAT family N-acetyltransferase n=1 Tax=Altibacter lentus TaxID=1223410 RepID=UPI00054DD338|nr:GNAT family N-acetyltransferase [Altibacter lentus]